MTSLAMERSHFEMGLAPVADFAGNDPDYSDVVNLAHHNRVRFITFWGVGTTGTIKFTVEACDNTTPSNVSAIPFTYRITAAGGTPGAPTRTTATDGVTNTAGSNQIVEIEITAADLAASGYSYARLKMDEVVDSAILGGILIEMLEPRYEGAAQHSAVV